MTTQKNKHGIAGQRIEVKGFPEGALAHRIASYAYQVSSGDMDFIYTIGAENGTFDMYRRSIKKGKNGYYDYGLCQINQGRFPDIVNNKKFRESRKYQIDKCRELYKGGTKFYGYYHRNIVKNRFIIK